MKKLLYTVAAVAVAAGVTVSGTAEANGPKVVPHTGVTRVVTTSHVVHTPTVVHTAHVVHTPKVVIAPRVVVHHPVNPAFANYHLKNGIRFSNGYFFRGHEYRQFQYRCYSNHYRCWVFYYPPMNCWYYWSAAQGCYYPVSYAPMVPPGGVLPVGTAGLPMFPGPQVPGQGIPGQQIPDQQIPGQVIPGQPTPDQQLPGQPTPDQTLPDDGTIAPPPQ